MSSLAGAHDVEDTEFICEAETRSAGAGTGAPLSRAMARISLSAGGGASLWWSSKSWSSTVPASQR